VDVFECLADATRRRLLTVLAQGDRTAGQLACLEPISRPAVSRHLRVMRQCGLVDVAADGRIRRYRLRPEMLAAVEDYLAILRRPPIPEAALDALDLEVRRASRDRARSSAPWVPAADTAPTDTEEIA